MGHLITYSHQRRKKRYTSRAISQLIATVPATTRTTRALRNENRKEIGHLRLLLLL